MLTLNGSRLVQVGHVDVRTVSHKARLVTRKVKCTVVLEEGASIVECPKDRPIHIAHRENSWCVACGQPAYPYFEYGDLASWSTHPRRCNAAVNP